MESEYLHKVLIVDKDEQVCKTINRILQTENIASVFVDTGEKALEEIRKTKPPFSLVIADQELAGMKGTQFLENAKKMSPVSIRYLMTAFSEMETIINAVNKGSIQRYIAKPLVDDEPAKAIMSGIKLHEFFLDNEKLLALAKKQNSELYELSCKLMEAAKGHTKTIHELDNDIERLEKEILDLSSQKTVNPAMLENEIESSIKKGPGIDSEKVEALFSDTIKDLYAQFNDLAQRSGFEMSEIKDEVK